jgi:hypothetical protein
VQHHIQPQPGKQAADVVKVVVAQDDVVDVLQVDPSALELLKRALAAIHEDGVAAMNNGMRWR